MKREEMQFSRAHPRACGENVSYYRSSTEGGGSSPRVRGKQEGDPGDPGALGLIPARAGKTIACSWTSATPTAHPRACGENVVRSAMSFGFPGSSPRVRGKRARVLDSARRVRLIPARAGKTGRSAGGGRRRSAHPRARGENGDGHGGPGAARGSSPRVRGKLDVGDVQPPRGGLIPARAGKTSFFRGTSVGVWAHPRACGENVLDLLLGGLGSGSSPRVRGKHPRRERSARARGLIPARAGKTSKRLSGSGACGAHPRACGENHTPRGRGTRHEGSSPRVRGKHLGRAQTHTRRGLIPARAGKTQPLQVRGDPAPAHPRACGENFWGIGDSTWAWGSSPRVRGKRADRCAGQPRQRLIPARAGKTRFTSSGRVGGRAHPRACGENIGYSQPNRRTIGSSPRVRGKPRRRLLALPALGLIPARAGKTGGSTPARRRCTAHPRACGENQHS